MKKLMFTLACAASVAAMADALQSTADFEAFDAGTTAATLVGKTDAGADEGNMYWAFANGSANDASVVDNDSPHANGGSKYLKLETNGDELQRKVSTVDTGTAVGDGLYIDTLVQFTATPEPPSIDAGAKLAIWLEGEEDTGYQLKVSGACIDYVNESTLGVSSNYVLTGTTSILPGTWYRLTVKSLSGVFNLEGVKVPGFQVYINGERLTINAASFTDNLVNAIDTLVSASAASWITDGKSFVTGNAPSFIPSAMCASEGYSFATVAELTSVGFQGSGAIDNVAILDTDPTVVVPTSVDFTITLGENVSSVTYTVTDAEGGTLSKTGENTFSVNIGATVTVTAATAADWYTVALPAAVTASAENKSIAVTATEKAASEIFDVPQGADNATVSKALAWAKAAGKSTTDVAGAANFLNNYLLNVDNLAVDPQIKIVEINLSGDVPAVTAEVTDAKGTTFKKTLDAKDIKGALKYKAAATLEALKTVESKDAIEDGDQFIKIVVE